MSSRWRSCPSRAQGIGGDGKSAVESTLGPTARPTSLSEILFGPDNTWDGTFDSLAAWKEQTGIPLTLGGHHWWHVDRDNFVYGDGYGIAGQRGTYYYYAILDPSIELGPDAPFDKVGVNLQGRFRDSGDLLRPFYPGTA